MQQKRSKIDPAIRARFEERVARCEAAWREGEALAIAEAATWCHLYQQPIPAWLEQAIVELAMARRSKQQAKRHTDAGIHLRRYVTVRDLKRGTPRSDGTYHPPQVQVSWEEAYERAAEMMTGTPFAGDAHAMKRSYGRVRRDLNNRRSGKYFTLKDRRYR